MTAPNHALAGALIGLSIPNPILALPLAFLSHFLLDTIPHYDQAEKEVSKRLGSKKFLWEFIILGAGLCVLLVIVLAFTRPHHWLQAAICAFLATSPDLLWIPRFLFVRRTGNDRPLNPFLKFHDGIQWKTGPKLLWVELVWFIIFTGMLFAKL